MGNRATTIDQQIEILQNRGLEIEDIPKAKEILLDIGYYRLGFYWNCFELDDNHNFTKGSKFMDAVNLYYLDVDLRELLLKYIYRIEIHFRTQIVYHVSNKYNQSPTWFIDSKVVSVDYIEDFKKIYDSNFIRNNKPIFKHHKKYINDKFAPAWKTIEFITFGAALKLFRSLKDEELKKHICSCYKIKKLYIFENFIQSIVYVRNMCSHGGVLYDLSQPKGIHKIPGNQYNFNNRHSLDATIKVICYILSQISANRENDLKLKLQEILGRFDNNLSINNIIKTKIGYSL
jgi:abortive infection bacteriophage resistance protein